MGGESRAPSAPAIGVTASGAFESVLRGLRVAIAVASYKTSAVAVLSAASGGLSLLTRAFDKPMGLAAAGNRLAIACRDELVVFADSPELGRRYDRVPGGYDHLWLPRSVRYTGEIDLHDPAFAGETVVGAATRLSCLARFDDAASLTPLWTPPFVSALEADDRCHLNGLALDEAGAPRFATALGTGDGPESWRAGRLDGGVVLSVPDGRVLRGGLSMPHSPRLHRGALHVLDSGRGEILRLDPDTGEGDVLARLPGFARGLAIHGDFLFVGLSRLRDRAGAGAEPLEIERRAQPPVCGLALVQLSSGRRLGMIEFAEGLDEISDLALLPGAGRHGLLGHTDPAHRAALALPGKGFWAPPTS